MIEQHNPGHPGGPLRSGWVLRGHLPPARVQYRVVDDLAVFEEDILLGTVAEMEQLAQSLDGSGGVAAAIVVDPVKYRWPNAVIPFALDPGLCNEMRTHIADAIEHWKANTFIRFRPRTNEDDFITFRYNANPRDCFSKVGRRGGNQDVLLGKDRGFGCVIHEIGHVVGLWHEQSRCDRDDFITIKFDNIVEERKSDFDQHISDGDDSGPYDYGSLMHYPAFTKNPGIAIDTTKPIIISPQPIGQRNGLSPGDIAAVSAFYSPWEPNAPDERTVPHVLYLPQSSADQNVRNVDLVPHYHDAMGTGIRWVFAQSPAPGTTVTAGSVVTMQLRTGPIP